MKSEITLACPAKVNLSLRVHGRRRDGFHEVSTVLQAIDLCDRLTVRRVDPGDPLELDVPGGGAPADDSNLVVAAARAFFEALGRPARGVRFELDKRIPAGSGLGGGSSDAAAALTALRQLWGNPMDARRLRTVAATVGSDVPFFLVGGTALATGRGEKLQPLEDVDQAPVLVAVPAVEVSTAEIYGAWSGAGKAAETAGLPLPPAARRREVSAWVLGNDLEPVVRRLHPEVDRLLVLLRDALGETPGPGFQVSGSGGAVFGLGDGTEAEGALAELDVRWFRASTLPRAWTRGGARGR